MELTLHTGVRDLPGIGEARAARLEKLGLATAEDLLRYFPRDYEDRRSSCTIDTAPVGVPSCVTAMVAEAPPALLYPEGTGADQSPGGGRPRLYGADLFQSELCQKCPCPWGDLCLLRRRGRSGPPETDDQPYLRARGPGPLHRAHHAGLSPDSGDLQQPAGRAHPPVCRGLCP